jgi:plasmid stabilization system protein ParE
LIYEVIFTPEVWAQLAVLNDYIADASSEEIAERYITALVRHCYKLETFPKRGTRRDDLRPGIRILGFRRRVSIVFEVSGTAVTILGIFYGGQDFEAMLKEPED